MMNERNERASSVLRPLSCELSTLHNADGSALWKSGSTQVLASIHGPTSPRLAQHEQQQAVISVVVKTGSAKSYEREWESFLTQTLSSCIMREVYSRCAIQVIAQVIHADGSVLASLFNASIAALLDAGIQMSFLPVAVTCGISLNDDSIQLDPLDEEERQEDYGIVVLVLSGKDDSMIGCHTDGIGGTSMDKLLRCVVVAEKTYAAIKSFFRLVVEQKSRRESLTLWSGSHSKEP